MNNLLIARTHTHTKGIWLTVCLFRLILQPVSAALRKNENKTSEILLHFNRIQLTIFADYSLLTNISVPV